MEDQKITLTLTQAEADWLADYLGGMWVVSYSSIDELDYFLPMLTTYKALINAGAAPHKDEPPKAVSA